MNALRRVLTFTSVNMKFIFLDSSQIDTMQSQPILDIDFELKKVSCQMDGPSLWQFIAVFKSTFLHRGEKSEDVYLLEEAMAKDLEKYKPDQLREMIEKEVKSQMGSRLS